MPRLTDRRAVGVAALWLPVALGAALLTAASGAVADPAPSTPRAVSAAVELTPRTATLPPTKRARTRPSAAGAAQAAVAQLPTWSSSFRYPSEHKTYGYAMVGTDPSASAGTTRVASTITPVSFRFADRHVVAPSSTLVRQITATGLYSSRSFPGGRGQYGDVYLRTQFWSALQNGRKNWHVLLGAPVRQPALALTVPSSQGGHVTTKTGATVYLVDVTWFNSQIQARVGAAAPSALTQFLGGDVVLCGSYSARDVSSCGIGGYHSYADDADGAHTYVYASFLSSKIFGARSAFYGLAPLSHEVAEWLTDPFVGNTVPSWVQPGAPQYPCGDALEVGDPLVGHILAVGGSVYQDEAYLAYFSRLKPSTSWNGRYTWFGTFTTPSRGC